MERPKPNPTSVFVSTAISEAEKGALDALVLRLCMAGERVTRSSLLRSLLIERLTN
jgi:hypothetical protein